MAGWTAHVLEQLQNNKLIRPESDYTGLRDVPYVPIDARG
jgi:citrate synthase